MLRTRIGKDGSTPGGQRVSRFKVGRKLWKELSTKNEKRPSEDVKRISLTRVFKGVVHTQDVPGSRLVRRKRR